MLGIGYVILLWHSLILPYNYLGCKVGRNGSRGNSAIPVLPKSEISYFQQSSVAVEPGLRLDLVGNSEYRFCHDIAQLCFCFPFDAGSATMSDGQNSLYGEPTGLCVQ